MVDDFEMFHDFDVNNYANDFWKKIKIFRMPKSLSVVLSTDIVYGIISSLITLPE